MNTLGVEGRAIYPAIRVQYGQGVNVDGSLNYELLVYVADTMIDGQWKYVASGVPVVEDCAERRGRFIEMAQGVFKDLMKKKPKGKRC